MTVPLVNTFIFISDDEDRYVVADDIEIPAARINFDGSHPAAECPSCDNVRVYLQGYDNPKPDGSSYTLHYLIEHILPGLRRPERTVTGQPHRSHCGRGPS